MIILKQWALKLRLVPCFAPFSSPSPSLVLSFYSASLSPLKWAWLVCGAHLPQLASRHVAHGARHISELIEVVRSGNGEESRKEGDGSKNTHD
jgi:hypothetical protein